MGTCYIDCYIDKGISALLIKEYISVLLMIFSQL